MASASSRRRRWFPARLLLPQKHRKSAAFQIGQAAVVLLPVPLAYMFMFLRARWRHHRNLRLAKLPTAAVVAVPPPSVAGGAPAPALPPLASAAAAPHAGSALFGEAAPDSGASSSAIGRTSAELR